MNAYVESCQTRGFVKKETGMLRCSTTEAVEAEDEQSV